MTAPPPTGTPPPPATTVPVGSAPGDPTTAAQALFRRASEKLDQRDFTAACPMLEEVLRLEPGANGARLTLAECYEGSGRLASAHRTYVAAAEVAARLGQTERLRVSQAGAAALRPRLGAVIVQVAPLVRVVPGLTLSACGAPLGEADRDRPHPADRGPCRVIATAPGRAPWERTVEVTDGATTSVTVDHLDPAPGVVLPVDPASPTAAANPGDPAKSPDPARPSDPGGAAGPGAARSASPPLSHRGQFGAFLRVDMDVVAAGAVTVLGATFAPIDHLEIALSGLLGKRAGFEASATGYILTGQVKPFLNVGAPVLFEGDAFVGIRGAAGVQWDMHRNVGVFFSIGGAYFPEVPRGYSQGVLLPAFGVQGRL